MKKILFLITGLVIMASCQHDVVYEVDYNITLDKTNTYYAGEPVRFNLSGEVDNLLFYSGEMNHQYKYASRYQIPIESVASASLNLELQARNGSAGALEIYVSNTFKGIDGLYDSDADTAAVRAMVKAGMPGWTKLQYNEGASTKWTYQDFNLDDYKDNFSIAFHWCPKRADAVQRTYWINGTVTVDIEGNPVPSTMKLTDLGMKSLMMNKEVDPYKKNAGNGSIRFDNAASSGEISFQGVGANALSYAIDGWVFTTPQPLNKIANDKGIVIKNLENYLRSYEYTWNEPGVYEVVFVGRNENYAAASEQIIRYTINIVEKPEN